MKLTPAKCPSCGANIEVNETLKNTICQYCGTTVLIEEAIEKYKIELSGKVEVEGIKSNAKKIETAKKHMLLGEYNKAQDLFNEVNEDDSFNIESQSLWIKNAILLCQLKVDYFAKNFAREDDLSKCNSVEMIVRHFDRLKKFDEAKEYEKFIDGELAILEYLKESYERLVADEKEFKEKADKIWSSVGLYIILITLADQLNLDRNEMSWVKPQINIKPNKNWTSTLTYKCIGLKITRNGGIVLYYKSTEFDYSATYYFRSKDGSYTKEQTIEKINKVFDMISDQKLINSINKQLSKNCYHWNSIDLNKKTFFQKLGF